MKANYLIKSGCLLTLTAANLIVTSTQADAPAFVLGGFSANPPSSFLGTRGWQFEHSASGGDILITQLGVFDSGGDGLVNAHQVGLWRLNDNVSGPLLASATVPAGTAAPLIGGYRFVPITPVLIPHGAPAFPYVVAAQYSLGDADDAVRPLPSVFASEVFPREFYGRFGFGPGLPFPSAGTSPSCQGCNDAERFWEPNFQFQTIPEPSIVLLLLPGSFYLCFRQRRGQWM